MLFTNREPASEFLPQTFIPTGHPGETVTLTVLVKRNLDRQCSIDVTRTFFDSNHTAELLTPQPLHVSAEGLALRERVNPGKLVFNVPIPKTASAGLGYLVSDVQYFCPFNPTTWVRKIDSVFSVAVMVEPKFN